MAPIRTEAQTHARTMLAFGLATLALISAVSAFAVTQRAPAAARTASHAPTAHAAPATASVAGDEAAASVKAEADLKAVGEPEDRLAMN